MFSIRFFGRFFRSGAIGGIILICCVAISLAIANSAWGPQLENILSTELGNEKLGLRYSILLWINDGLMAIFFLLIGLEIKREIVEGELSSFKKASLPVLAAFGGAIIPAIIYLILNKNQPGEAGWGIPMATDIAFALGILALLGKKVPASLKIFLAALAIADDLIAIVVIAFFYSQELHTMNLLYAGIIFALMLLFNRFGVKSIFLYIVPGIFMWYFIHHSGVHATIAGVLTAFTLPTTPGREISSLEKLEHSLTVPVNYFIMPLFALANTNINLQNASLNDLSNNVSMGIIIGLIFGKPIGIYYMSWLSVKLGWSRLPANAGWKHILGVGLLGGIGFTMSIFIALLSFTDETYQSTAKIAILAASVIAATAGIIFLRFARKSS